MDPLVVMVEEVLRGTCALGGIGAAVVVCAAEEEEDADEPQAVQVRFAGAETERSKRARERSFHFLQQQQDNEPWSRIKFHPLGVRARCMCTFTTLGLSTAAVIGFYLVGVLCPIACVQSLGFVPCQQPTEAPPVHRLGVYNRSTKRL